MTAHRTGFCSDILVEPYIEIFTFWADSLNSTLLEELLEPSCI